MGTARVLCPHCSAEITSNRGAACPDGRCTRCGHDLSWSRSNPDALPPTATFKPSRSPDRPAEAEGIPDEFGRYRILRKLGEGGMGAVYLAHDSMLDRRVALKVPHFRQDDLAGVARFYQEARAAAKLDHTNLCPVHDVGQIDGIHYLTMPYIEGKPLSKLIDPQKPTSLRTAAALVRKLALAMQEAHRRGIIHRDLKPSNIMASRGRELVIMDFGLARPVNQPDGHLTASGALVGTPYYMAPEQVEGSKETPIGPAADIYSLGVVLYELLTCRRPFDGPVTVVLAHVLMVEPPPVAQFRPDVDPALEAICRRAMAKKPQDRYPSMAAFAEALGGYLQGTDRRPETMSQADEAPVPTGPAAPPASPVGTDILAARFFAELEGPETSSPTLSTNVAASSRPPRVPGKRLLASMAGAAAIAVLLGVIVYVRTGRGTIRLEVNDPGVVVQIDGDEVHLAALDEPLVLRTGRHTLVLRRGETEIESRAFTIRRGTNPPLALPALRAELIEVEGEPPRPSSQPALGAEPVAEKRPEPPAIAQPAPNVNPVADAAVPPQESWVGLIARPAPLTGGRRFQVETIRPRSEIYSVAWSPDGQRLALGTGHGEVRLYEMPGLRLTRILPGHSGAVSAIAWSCDGRWLASVSFDKTGRIWGRDGTPGPVLRGHGDAAHAVAWSPTGGWVATGANDGTTRLWRPDGTPGLVLGAEGSVVVLAWGPKGDQLAYGSTAAVQAYAVPDGTAGTRHRVAGRVLDLAWDTDGRLAAVCRDGTVRTWDSDGKEESRRIGPGELPVAARTPSGRVAAGEPGGRVRVLEPDGRPGPQAEDGSKAAKILAWNLEGHLAVVDEANELRIWRLDGAAGPVFEAQLEAGFHYVPDVAWSPDGQWLASTDDRDGAVRLWTWDGKLERVLRSPPDLVKVVAWHPDGTRLALGNGHAEIHLWSTDGTPGPVLRRHDPHGPKSGITSLAWHPEGRMLACGTWDGTVRFWGSDGSPGPILEMRSETVDAVAWSPDSRLLASGGSRPQLRLWDSDGLPVDKAIDQAPTLQTLAVAWRPDGRGLAALDVDRRVRLFDADLRPGPIFGPTSWHEAIDWHPDGRWLATADLDAIKLWTPEGRLAAAHSCHDLVFPTSLDCSPDGQRLA